MIFLEQKKEFGAGELSFEFGSSQLNFRFEGFCVFKVSLLQLIIPGRDCILL
jgi:hypothetical protein